MRVTWGEGPVGDAVRASFDARVMRFVQDEESEAIQLFSTGARADAKSGDWYGEHAGKWLVTVALAYRRTQSEDLAVRIRRVVSYLESVQEPDGYLGTYAPDSASRLTDERAESTRTWDIWVHAWLILGLLEASSVPGIERARGMAERIGNLILRTFADTGRSVLDLGNHQGLSSAVIIHPLAELSVGTGNPLYADYATLIVEQMEARGLTVLSGAEAGQDVSQLGTGKSYQLCWVLVGLAALHQATGNAEYLRAVAYWWENIAANHLTPMGGPWGGVATHKEVFNPAAFFSPNGMTETCTTASWMALNWRLFELTGEGKYADAYVTSLKNALLGALDEKGADWCYFTFPNGRRNNTYHWACCKSSGAMALEEMARMAATERPGGVSLNLWASVRVEGEFGVVCAVVSADETQAHVSVDPRSVAQFELEIRMPVGVKSATFSLNDEPARKIDGESLRLVRPWRAGDAVTVSVEFAPRVVPFTYTLDHHGQEVVRTDYAALHYGPYVYATGLIDGYRKEETLRLPRLTPEAPFAVRVTGPGMPRIDLVQPGRTAIPFAPYFEAGGRHDGAWRATWMQVAWQ